MKISIALCTYNGEKYLPEQLNSFLAQSRLPDEIVISDDNSSDATRAVIEEFAANSPVVIRFYQNKINLRSSKNFERAISLCAGDIIALSDQDDVWHPDKLKIFADVFAAKPEVGLVFCDADVVDENLNPLGITNWQMLDFDRHRQNLIRTDAAFDYLLKNVAVFGCMMAFRADFKELVLPIKDNLYRVIHDNWIAMLIAAVASIEPIPERLVSYRQHSAQQIGHRPDDNTNFVVNVTKKHDYDSEIYLLTAFLERFKNCSERFPAEKAVKTLESRLRHFENRRKMRAGGVRKFSLIAEELLTSRYRVHTSGVKSALKDLFAA